MATLLEPIRPGEILRKEFLKPMRLKHQPSRACDHGAPGRISEIVNGKRGITADTALRLARAVGVSSDVWLGLQTE